MIDPLEEERRNAEMRAYVCSKFGNEVDLP
jgi:hypothetical protein